MLKKNNKEKNDTMTIGSGAQAAPWRAGVLIKRKYLIDSVDNRLKQRLATRKSPLVNVLYKEYL